jgi:hypothetical protein
VGADVFQGVYLVVLQIQADVLAIDFHAQREIGVELVACGDVMPFGAQILWVHTDAAFWMGQNDLFRSTSETLIR